MDTWLKVLVAITCACVIGVSAHYGYAKLSEQREEVRKQEADTQRVADELEKMKRAADERRAAAEAVLVAECEKRVPSQSTENLKQLFRQCIEYNRPLYN